MSDLAEVLDSYEQWVLDGEEFDEESLRTALWFLSIRIQVKHVLPN